MRCVQYLRKAKSAIMGRCKSPKPETEMALDINIAPYDAPRKDLYEVGEMPPLGHVPQSMYA